MEKYDYYIEVTNDIKNWLDFNDFDLSQFEDRDEAADFLNDNLWAEDSITGNGPYGYANESLSEEYLCHNLDLVFEACNCFDVNWTLLLSHYKEGNLARYLDCTIRCYLLSTTIDKVLEEYESYGHKYKEE